MLTDGKNEGILPSESSPTFYNWISGGGSYVSMINQTFVGVTARC